MKKYLQTEPGGGVPLDNELLFLLQDQPFQSIQTLLTTIGSTWVVDGCTVSYINTTTKTCIVTPGFVYIGGELRPFDGATSAYPFYIIAAPDTYETADFGNGAQQNYLVSKRATTTTVLPTSAAYLTVDPTLATGDDTVTKRIRPLLNGDLTAALNREITDRVNADNSLRTAIVAEAQVRADADTTLQNNINTLAATVAQKQNRVTTKIAWTDIVIGNPYYTSTENVNDANATSSQTQLKYNKFQMMRTEDGIVHVRGYIKGNGGGFIVSQGALPAEFRPKNVVQHIMAYSTAGSANYASNPTTFHTIEIDPYGGIVHSQQLSQPISPSDPTGAQLIGLHPWFVLDGFCYSVE